MSALANSLLALAQTVAASRGRIMRVTIDNGRLHFKFTGRGDDDGYIHEEHYDNAALFVDGYADELRIDESDTDKLDLVATGHVKHYMQQDVLRSSTSTRGDDFDLHAKLLVGVIVAIMIMTGVIVAVLA